MSSVSSINSVSFKSKYQTDINQKTIANDKGKRFRDVCLGYYAAKADNINELADTYFNWIKQNDWQDKPCNVTINLPDEYDAEFEIYMHAISQNFNKIA